MKTKTEIEEFLDRYLEDYTYEEIFELLQIDIYEVLEIALESGMIDEELLEGFL